MKTTAIEPHKSSLGMDANIAALLIYVVMIVIGWIPYVGWVAWAVPIVFYVLEKQSKFVKFNAITALIVGIIRAVISIVLQIFIWMLMPSALELALGRGWGLWSLLGVISTIIGLAITLVLVYLIFMAYTYKQVEIPGIGPIAAKLSENLDKINIDANKNQNSSQSNQTNNNNDYNNKGDNP